MSLVVLYLINMLKVLLNMNKNLKKNQSQLTNKIVYDIETFITTKGVPYSNCIHRLSKVSGKYNGDIKGKQYQKYLNDCVVFKGTDCIFERSDHV